MVLNFIFHFLYSNILLLFRTQVEVIKPKDLYNNLAETVKKFIQDIRMNQLNSVSLMLFQIIKG